MKKLDKEEWKEQKRYKEPDFAKKSMNFQNILKKSKELINNKEDIKKEACKFVDWLSKNYIQWRDLWHLRNNQDIYAENCKTTEELYEIYKKEVK